ncbi:ANTAR domain-containing protein [Streptomyces alboflavus]|uniref:ANTAR domain-containing protein n=1 Tax=Streptomyces alboflavus TaxID=67267 RepID=UPI003695AAA0
MPDHSPVNAETDHTIAELKEEVAHLKKAVDSHAIVDQAIGLLVGVGQITPAEAWDVLREVSMNTNTKLREVAQTLIDWGCTGVLPGDIGHELGRRLTNKRLGSECAQPQPLPSDVQLSSLPPSPETRPSHHQQLPSSPPGVPAAETESPTAGG